MKKWIFLVYILPLLFFSCDLFSALQDLREGEFWALNFRSNKYYRLNADLVKEGEYCQIWLETGHFLDPIIIQELARAFDEEIYPSLIKYFSLGKINYSGREFSNTMEFADWLGNHDGKLTILLLDIKDNYEKDVYDSYTAGYFISNDLFHSLPYSNKRDMIYIDIDPGIVPNIDPKETNLTMVYKTLMHEAQHLMNYASRVAKNRAVDTWINEGLSLAAEYVYSGIHSFDRIHWFFTNGMDSNSNERGLINKGNNFFVWNNRTDESPYAVLDDYATAYMFFIWLYRQAGDFSVYKDIFSSDHGDYRAVLNAINNSFGNSGSAFPNWEALLKTWLAANYINAEDSVYGYRGYFDYEFQNEGVPVMSAPEPHIQLFPGEGVYSSIQPKGFSASSPSGNIKYTSLIVNPAAGKFIDDDEFAEGNILLTYNAGLSGRTSIEGETTGFAPAKNIIRMRSFISMPPVTGPLRVGPGE